VQVQLEPVLQLQEVPGSLVQRVHLMAPQAQAPERLTEASRQAAALEQRLVLQE
jgi:hypothetical protein